MIRRPIPKKSKSESALTKDAIQAMVRAIVMKRDGGCILRDYRPNHTSILQADHLITRSNSATYADTRLIVCVCTGCHGWKHWHKEEYDALVKSILTPDRVQLWTRAEAASWQPHRKYTYDWKIELAALKQEYLNTTPLH